MGDGYDYGQEPGYGAGGGPPPGLVGPLILLILVLILFLVAGAMMYRRGAAAERRRAEEAQSRTGKVIFDAVRARLNGALLATGEQVFAPARTLMETIDLYLGPVLLLMGGLSPPAQQLRKALTTTQKEVEVKHEAPPTAHNGATIILTPPLATAGGAAAATGGGAVASAATDAGGGIHIYKTASAGEPAKDGHKTGEGGHGAVEKKKVDLTLKEQARNVREALEALSEYWQEDRVKDQIAKAQKALLITQPLGTVTERAADRAAFFSRRSPTAAPPASPVTRAARGASGGFPWFKP